MRCSYRIALCWLLAVFSVQGCTDRLGLDEFPPAPLVFGAFGGVDQPPVPTPAKATPLGLESAVAGDTSLRLEWRAPSAFEPIPDMAILLTDDFGVHQAGSPRPITPGTTHMVIKGLASNQLWNASLGYRASGSDPFTSVGPSLTARTAAPLYVDIAAPSGGDGSSPANASNDLILMVLISFSGGGGNIWVANGDYPGTSLPLFANVDLYGGFPSDFDLEQRDTTAHATRLQGLIDLPVVSLLNGESLTILDGFQLQGGGLASIGLEVEDSTFEGRKLQITQCKRGIKLRRGPFSDSVDMQLVASSSRNSVLQGLSGQGPLNLSVDGCDFSGNGQEGFELSSWLAPENENMKLHVRDSSFTGNGAEGVDVDMVAPAGGGNFGGHFDLLFESCTAQTNAFAGFLIDIDYDLADAWTSDTVFSGCYARANGGPGIHADLDAHASLLVHRSLCTANRSHGFQITSESQSGTVVVSASAFVGNLGHGVHSSFGNFGLLLSQSILSGNQSGGVFSSPAPVSVVSCVAYLQSSPWPQGSAQFSVQQNAPDPAPFLSSARAFGQIHIQNGTLLTLAQAPGGNLNGVAEIGDDRVPRSVLDLSGTQLELASLPTSIIPPEPIAFYAPGSDVVDQYELSDGSIARGAGLPEQLGGSTDAGPFGAPVGGIPGAAPLFAAPLFHFSGSTPTWAHPIHSNASLELSFVGGSPDPTSAPAAVEIVDANGASIDTTISVFNDLLLIAAPGSGWPTGASLRLHANLSSAAGDTLSAAVVIPLHII